MRRRPPVYRQVRRDQTADRPPRQSPAHPRQPGPCLACSALRSGDLVSRPGVWPAGVAGVGACSQAGRHGADWTAAPSEGSEGTQQNLQWLTRQRRRVPAADLGRMAARLSCREHGRAVRPPRRGRLAPRQLRRADPYCGRQSAQRMGSVRHAGQCVGLVVGHLRRQGVRHLPGAPWWWMGRRALELPGIGTAAQPPDFPDRRPGIPRRTLQPGIVRTNARTVAAHLGPRTD